MLVQTFATGRLMEKLSTKTLPELRAIAKSSGILIGGRKEEVVQRITNALNEVQKPCSSVLSFDLGYRNMAYCHLSHDATVLDWARVDLDLTEFHPLTVAPIVRKFMKEHIEHNIEKTDVIIAERQRSRTSGGIGVLEHTLRVNAVEGMLWSGIYEIAERLQRSDLSMIAQARQQVDSTFEAELQTIIENNALRFSKMKKGSYSKKRAGVLLVQEWMKDKNKPHLKVSDKLKEMFDQEIKKDDLSDCLLQAVAWYKWRQFRQDYVEQSLKITM